MSEVYKSSLSKSTAFKLLTGAKDPKCTWCDHYLYVCAVSEEAGGFDALVPENIAKFARPELKIAMMARYDPKRTDFLIQAVELAAFAESLEDDKDPGVKEIGKETPNAVNAVTNRKETRTCYI